jgi:type II secretory pathway component PulM
MASKVFMISGRRLCRQSLEKQQVEFRRLADQGGQHGVDLSPVMGLVIAAIAMAG